jgi:hypothetical protein
MVIILEPNKRKSKSQQFGEAFGNAVSKGAEFGYNQHQKKEENESAKKLGLDLSGIHDPKIRQEAFKELAKHTAQKNMLEQLGLGGDFSDRNEEIFNANNSNQLGVSENNKDSQNELKVKIPSLIPIKKIQQMAMINPAVADKMQKFNDNLLRDSRHAQDLQLKQDQFKQKTLENSPDFIRNREIASAQAKSDVDYNKQLQSAASQNEIKTKTLNKLDNLNRKGVTGKPFEKLLEKAGLVNLTSSGRREFAADVKHLITDIRSILGGQFSNFEFQTILNAYPSADFSQEANEAIIKNLKEFQEIRNKEFEFANQIKKENNGKPPEFFQEKVNEKIKQFAQERLPEIKENNYKIMSQELGIEPGFVLMFSPEGDPLNIPLNQFEHYQSLGASMFP